MSQSALAPLFDGLEYGSCQDAPSLKHSYVVAAMSAVVVVALWVAGKDQLLRIAIPAMATLTAVALYFERPILYIRYTLWVWFLAPLIRRIIDWHFGFVEPNFVLVTPLVVSAVAGLTVLIPGRRPNTRIPILFVLCGIAIVYGFVVGMLLNPSSETVYGLCNWLCPMLFGLHIFLNWGRYDEHRSTINTTFLWGALLLGAYGIYQYFSPPAWDRYWLESITAGGGNQGFGQPEAFQVRVWSTLNSPGPFANVMLAGLLILFTVRSSWKIPALFTGYMSLLLSLVRTTWLSWFVGLSVLLKKSKSTMIARVLALIILIGVCLLPFINDPRLDNVLGDRFQTLSDLNHDESFGERVDMYRILATTVIENPFGYGVSNQNDLRNVALDSGILRMFFAFGWFGTILFTAGIISFLLADKVLIEDHSMFAYRAVTIALIAQIIGGNIFIGVNGLIFWALAGTYLAAVYVNLQSQRDCAQSRL